MPKNPARRPSQKQSAKSNPQRQPPAASMLPAPAAASPKLNIARQASIVAVFGATGTGKSTFIKAELAGLPRPVLIFDPKHEYPDQAPSELVFLQRAGQFPVLTLRPSFNAELRERQFDRFCAAALCVARAMGRVSVVVDELHLVTAPGRAPRYWRELIETGRSLGVSIICASIRPAAVDKSLWTNLSKLRAGRLNFEDDCKVVANSLGVPWRDVMALKSADGRIEWIERDLLSGSTRRGNLTF